MIKINNKDNQKKIIIGLPKGSLQDATFRLFEKAGFKLIVGNRSYFPTIDDPEIECVLLRAQEIANYVEDGVLDAGITGADWIQENGADIEEVGELVYGKMGMGSVKWVIAVADESNIKTINDLNGKIIATEIINLTKNYLIKNNIDAKVEFSWGATEIKARGLADAIVDVTETGSSLKANNLRVLDTLIESTTRLISNKKSWNNNWKRQKMKEVFLLLKGVLLAETKVMVMMNVRKENLKDVLKIIPAMNTPTISDLSDKNWCDVITIMDRITARELIPKLKSVGAEAIVESSINKIIE